MKYDELLNQFSCGRQLAEHLSSELVGYKNRCNEALQKLELLGEP
jgi:hypothetical protein